MKMKMCYRGVHYDYSPVTFNLNEQQKYFIDHSLDKTQTIQIKFLGKICHKKAFSLPVTEKKTRFLGQSSDRTIISPTSTVVGQTKVNKIA